MSGQSMGRAMAIFLMLSASPAVASRGNEKRCTLAAPSHFSPKATHPQESPASTPVSGPAAWGSGAGPMPQSDIAQAEATQALVETEAGMTDGTNQSVSDPITNFFKFLTGLCTDVDGVDQGEIQWQASTTDLQQMLPQFPNGDYIYKRDAQLIMSPIIQNEVVMQGQQYTFPNSYGLQFKVIGNQQVSGDKIIAVAIVNFNQQQYKGFVTLFDPDGSIADPPYQPVQHDQLPQNPTMNKPNPQWGKIEKNLGEGAFGKVVKTSINLGSGYITVAQKVPSNHPKAPELLKKEIQVMIDVANANIKSNHQLEYWAVQPVYWEWSPPVLALEFSPYGDLDSQISKLRRYPTCFWRMIVQISMVFELMPLLTHRDIKPENILLFPSKDTTQVNFKLADFGLASNDGSVFLAGTPPYQPPESRTHGQMTRTGDMFSLGVTVLEMILGSSRGGQGVSEAACTLTTGCVGDWKRGSALIRTHVVTMINQYIGNASPYPGHLQELTTLLRGMVHPNPNNRMTFEKLNPLLNKFGAELQNLLACPASLLSR